MINKPPQKLFIPFMLAGFPNYEISCNALLALGEAGADVIEVGVPHSDPLADGPVIQKAHYAALQHGMNLKRTFALIEEVRQRGLTTPIVLFSYLNPILSLGFAEFAIAVKRAKINAVLLVDLPLQTNCEYTDQLSRFDISQVLLASPTTPLDRVQSYQPHHPYFIYYIARMGVTGAQSALSQTLRDEIQTIRAVIGKQRLCAGFGISSIAQAQTVAQHADGVIIGSLLVQALSDDFNRFKAMARAFGQGIHGACHA
jgi:tryptophan synthase alpha chain